MNRVAVCLATYRRPTELIRALWSLDALEFPRRDVHVEVLVVDNDPDGTGLRAVDALADELAISVRTIHEPTPGIPQARNAAVAAAGDADYLAFVDDDEFVDAGWLDELLRVAHTYTADVVTGPVLVRLPSDAPDWIVRGRFFERDRFPTGTRRPYAATNNVLVARHVFEAVEGFDDRLALTGGSDREFFDRVADAGFTIVWADQALVHEVVSPERMNARWILRRSYRLGNNIAVRLRLGDATPGRYLYEIGFALARTLVGALRIVSGAVRGRHAVIRGLRSVVAAAGTLTGMFGRTFEEYARDHEGRSNADDPRLE